MFPVTWLRGFVEETDPVSIEVHHITHYEIYAYSILSSDSSFPLVL